MFKVGDKVTSKVTSFRIQKGVTYTVYDVSPDGYIQIYLKGDGDIGGTWDNSESFELCKEENVLKILKKIDEI